jgi:hypothetical protein
MFKAVNRYGHVELTAPVDWPRDREVDVLPPRTRGSGPAQEKGGMDESEWPATREGTTALIARMASREPVE